MKTKLFKTSVAIFFLLLFSSGKAFGYHALLHDHHAHNVECEVCDKALIDQFSPLDSTTQQTEIKEIIEGFSVVILNSYTSEILTTQLNSALFSRPPPSLD